MGDVLVVGVWVCTSSGKQSPALVNKDPKKTRAGRLRGYGVQMRFKAAATPAT